METENRKEMIGKRDNFKATNSQRWNWGDVGRQTVPEAASSHRTRTIISVKWFRRVTRSRC